MLERAGGCHRRGLSWLRRGFRVSYGLSVMSPTVIYPEFHMPPVPSLIASYGVCGVLPLLLASFAALNWARDRLRARRAKAATESTAPAADGQTVVHGTVELAQGATHAARVEIEQFGFESCYKHSWSHEWKELERRMLVEPFYVREPNGRRIRVEATTDAYIIDELDEMIQTARDKRVRAATVNPGEEVYVFGVLGFGKDPEAASSYRDDGHGLVLRSPDAGHMLLATTSPAARFRASTRVHGLWVVIFILLAGVFQIMNVMHSVRVAAGQTATATVLGTRTYTTEGKKAYFTITSWSRVAFPMARCSKKRSRRRTGRNCPKGQKSPSSTCPANLDSKFSAIAPPYTLLPGSCRSSRACSSSSATWAIERRHDPGTSAPS